MGVMVKCVCFWPCSVCMASLDHVVNDLEYRV